MSVDLRAMTPWQWLGNLTLTEEWRPALVGPPRRYVIGQTWTLCYEEQFYLIVGLLLLVSRRWFFAGVCAVTIMVLLNTIDLNATLGRQMGLDLNALQVRVPGLFINGLWLAFAAGVAVYYRVTHATKPTGRFLELILLLSASYWAIRELAPFDASPTRSKYLFVSSTFALLLCWLHPFDARLNSMRCLAPFRFFGRICYSMYLTHPLVTIPVAWVCFRVGLTSPGGTLLVTIPIAASLSVVLGWGFHRLVERHFLNPPVVGSPVPERNTYTSPEYTLCSGHPQRTPPCPAVGSQCSP